MAIKPNKSDKDVVTAAKLPRAKRLKNGLPGTCHFPEGKTAWRREGHIELIQSWEIDPAQLT
jgi:hypothetical protein